MSDSEIQLGSVLKSNKFFASNHSIPDSVGGYVLKHQKSAVVHTGDFKFDHTPVNGQYADLQRMAQIGTNSVLALLSDQYEC